MVWYFNLVPFSLLTGSGSSSDRSMSSTIAHSAPEKEIERKLLLKATINVNYLDNIVGVAEFDY